MTIIQIRKTCPGCRSEFVVPPSQQHLVCCSRACRAKYAEERRNARVQICPVCGDSFMPAKGKTRTYCSRQCAGIEKRDRPRGSAGWIDKTCPVCGTVFQVPPSRAHVICCSTECGYERLRGLPKNLTPEARSRIVGRPKTSKDVTRTCPTCGTEFTLPEYIKQAYCSRPCFHATLEGPQPSLVQGPVKACATCGKEFQVPPSRADSARFCSKRCWYDSRGIKALEDLRDMTEAEVAWLAGLFDGEGSIVEAQRTRPHGGSLRITITNTVHPMLEKVCEITGVGSLWLKKSKNPRHQDAWIWSVSGSVALELLRRMRPWLFARADRADAALAGKKFPRQARWDHRYGEDVIT